MKQAGPSGQPDITLGEIARTIGIELRGRDDVRVRGVAPLTRAGADEISFLANPRLRRHLTGTRAAAVILAADDAGHCPVPVLVADNPHLAFAQVAQLLVAAPTPPAGIHPSAVVHDTARIDPSASVGPLCVIERDTELGSGVVIGPACVVGAGVRIGRGTRLVARVTLCHGVVLGERCVIHPGAVIGGDGFGLADDGGRWVRVPQLGRVLIGNDVDIGCNTTVDRGALDDTVIEDGVKLDNLIQVGHNTWIGAHSAAAGCVGIAGSARIGRHCTLGGGAGIGGHLELADNVHITGMSMVSRSIAEPGVYSSGFQVEPNRRWNRINARIRRIDEIFQRLEQLERRAPDKNEPEETP